jgi:hypothetical protein
LVGFAEPTMAKYGNMTDLLMCIFTCFVYTLFQDKPICNKMGEPHQEHQNKKVLYYIFASDSELKKALKHKTSRLF